MPSAAGFKRPGLECVHCQKPFAVLLGVPPAQKDEERPDPFRAMCPHCYREGKYPRSAIGTVAAV